MPIFGSELPVVFERQIARNGTPVAYSTAGAITYTVDDLLTGLVLRDCNGSGRTDVLPTSENIFRGLRNIKPGTQLRFIIRNTSGGATAITLDVTGTNITAVGTAVSSTITQNNQREFILVCTNAIPGSIAFSLYAASAVAAF